MYAEGRSPSQIADQILELAPREKFDGGADGSLARCRGVTTTPLRDALQADLKTAMAARDRTAVAVLRTTLAAISNAEAVSAAGSRPEVGAYANEVERLLLDEDDVRALVERERAELLASADEYDAVDQADEAANLRAQVAVLDRYLELG